MYYLLGVLFSPSFTVVTHKVYKYYEKNMYPPVTHWRHRIDERQSGVSNITQECPQIRRYLLHRIYRSIPKYHVARTLSVNFPIICIYAR